MWKTFIVESGWEQKGVISILLVQPFICALSISKWKVRRKSGTNAGNLVNSCNENNYNFYWKRKKISDIVARQKHPAGPAGCQSINYFNRCLLLVCAGPRMSTNNETETKLHTMGFSFFFWNADDDQVQRLKPWLCLTCVGGGVGVGVFQNPTSTAPLLASRLCSQEGDFPQ